MATEHERPTIRRRGVGYEVEDGCLVDKRRPGRHRIYLFVWTTRGHAVARRSLAIIDGRDKRAAERKMIAWVREHKAKVLSDRQVDERRVAVGWAPACAPSKRRASAGGRGSPVTLKAKRPK